MGKFIKGHPGPKSKKVRIRNINAIDGFILSHLLVSNLQRQIFLIRSALSTCGQSYKALYDCNL